MHKTQPHIALFGLKGFPAIGGTSSVGENLVQHLNKDYRFTVYATSSHCSEKNPYDNVRMFIFKKYMPHKLNVFYYNLMGALHALLFCNYDLVHTHQIDTGFIVPLLRLRYKVISTHHGRTYNMSKWGKGMKYFFRCTEKMMIRFANVVTFVAETEREAARLKYHKEFVTICNGVDPDQKIGTSEVENDYIMFAAGRIIPHKGCHVFLEALKKMNYQGKILIAGDHEQLPEYKKQLELYKESLDITFLGMLMNKAELLGYVKGAQLFVFPSFYEAMSMMLLEVALVKTPLICSDIRENTLVFNEEEVSYFKSGDVDDLAMKIQKALSYPDQITIKAQAAYHKACTEYNWQVLSEKYKELYQFLLQ
nr:glycosyltransferase family 4 protein [uncultured Carboxylicivirga sp.]